MGDVPEPTDADRLYHQFIQEKERKGESALDTKVWIGKFEESLSTLKDEQPVYWHILFSLADTYDSEKDKNSSDEIYKNIFRSTKSPALLRVLAGEHLLYQNEQEHRNDMPFLERLDAAIGKLGSDEKSQFMLTLHASRILWVDSVLKENKTVSARLTAEGLRQDAHRHMQDTCTLAESKLLKSASEFSRLGEEQQTLLNQMNLGLDSTLFRLGEIRCQLGLSYIQNGQNEKGKMLLESAKAALTEMLDKSGKDSLFVARAAVTLLQIQESVHGTSNKEFLQYTATLTRRLQNLDISSGKYPLQNHTFQNYLIDKAMLFGRDGTREIAAELYDMVLEQEKKFFPEKYKDNLNYQLALASGAHNLSEIGNASKMQKYITELNTCKIIDEGTTKQYVDDLVSHAKDRIKEIHYLFDALQHPSQTALFRPLIVIINVVILLLIIFLWYFTKRQAKRKSSL
jgi:tetratricopeptide (TPR) repeat protein